MEVLMFYREPKDLEEEQDLTILKKTVKISRETEPINHLVSILSHLGKEEIELKNSFSKYINLKFLFFETLQPHQREDMLEDLFLDFLRNGLYGRSKEKTKLILLLDLTPLGHGIVLIQTTITGKEIRILRTKEGETLVADDRFLDEHNVYRFVYFYVKDEKIYFKAHQNSYSKHFVEWLQIEEEMGINITRELDFSFLCKYGNLTLQISLNESTLSEIIDKEHQYEMYLDVANKQLVIEPLRFEIVKIRVKGAKKEFKDVNAFLRYLKDRKSNIDLVRDLFNRALEKLKKEKTIVPDVVPIIAQGLDELPIVEDKDNVHIGEIKINKKIVQLPHSFAYLIISDHPSTTFSEEFLNEIATALRDGKVVRLVTIHYPISEQPTYLGPVELYHLITPSMALSELSQFYKVESSTLPSNLRELLVAVILDLLSRELGKLQFFFKQLIGKYLEAELTGRVLYFETDLVEYKRPDVLYGEKDKVTKRLIEEIIKKLKSDIIVFVIGVDGKTRELQPVDTGKINDDYIREIFREINEIAEKSSISVLEPYPIPINPDGWIVVFCARKTAAENN